MAPRRGGAGSSISSCPDAFTDSYSQVNLADTVLFLVIFSGISIALCLVRKKSGAAKKILGIPYTLALVLFILSYGLDLVATVLQECGSASLDSYYGLAIASNIFSFLGLWLLLFVCVYVLNTMLRERLGGVTRVFKIIYIAIVGVMFAITCGEIGVLCYNLWTQTEAGYDANAELLGDPAERLGIVYNVLYLLSVVASGALSLSTIFALRSRRHPSGDLLGWVIALSFSMVVWVLIFIVFATAYLQDNTLSFEASAALMYISNFFQALSFIFLLCIAKHASWSKSSDTATAQVYSPVGPQQQTAYAPMAVPQQQYAYNNNNNINEQQYYYQQAPVYNGTPNPVYGQHGAVEPK